MSIPKGTSPSNASSSSANTSTSGTLTDIRRGGFSDGQLVKKTQKAIASSTDATSGQRRTSRMKRGTTKIAGIAMTSEVRSAAEAVLELPCSCSSKDMLRSALQASSEAASSSSANNESVPMLPLKAVVAAREVMACCEKEDEVKHAREALEKAVAASTREHGGLMFQVKLPKDQRTSEEKKEAAKFQRRLEKLRLKTEEGKYHKLTSNLDKTVQDDDVTTRSMTYAASIGLNMTMAPLSFGAFVFFFVAPMMFPYPGNVRNDKDLKEVDAETISLVTAARMKRVMVAVLGGVAMLFIEMILFVIRTHDLETNVKKRKKKEKSGPFGRKGW